MRTGRKKAIGRCIIYVIAVTLLCSCVPVTAVVQTKTTGESVSVKKSKATPRQTGFALKETTVSGDEDSRKRKEMSASDLSNLDKLIMEITEKTR